MTVTATEPNQFQAGEPLPWQFNVRLRRQKNGPELKHVPATAADLSDALGEVWCDGWLRKGMPDVPLHEVLFEISPKRSTPTTSRCQGFVLRASHPAGGALEREFTIDSFRNIAMFAYQQLIKIGVMQADDEYHYEVTANLAAADKNGHAESEQPPGRITAKRNPLAYLKTPLAPLWRHAKRVGPVVDGLLPVFYVEAAYAKADRCARKGASRHPAVETGGVLVGMLCSCPDSGELFLVVCDVLELVDAEETTFSLAYTGKTWSRIQAVIKARQTQPATRALRVLGQCHGHNFLPAGGAPPCEICAGKPEVPCARTSVFVSADDRLWSQAVFTHQPWQLCHIFGLNARKENVHALFGLKDNQLLQRGFHLIPEFTPGGDSCSV